MKYQEQGQSQATPYWGNAERLDVLIKRLRSKYPSDAEDSEEVCALLEYRKMLRATPTVPDAAPSPTDRDWPEDAAHENGNYSCKCDTCGNTFTGHKRRLLCKLCAAAPSPDCRAAFEKDLTQEQKKRHPQLDHYIDSVVDAQWLGWQARGEYESARIRDSIAKGDTRCSDCPCRYGHHCARTPTPPITPEQREAAIAEVNKWAITTDWNAVSVEEIVNRYEAAIERMGVK